MKQNPSDARNLRQAIDAIDQARRIANEIRELDECNDPGAGHRLASYGRSLLDRAYQHVQRLSFYCTGAKLDLDLRRQLSAVRGRL